MNEIKFQIEDDGTISVETSEMAGVDHKNADELIKFLNKVVQLESSTPIKPSIAHHHQRVQATTDL